MFLGRQKGRYVELSTVIGIFRGIFSYQLIY